MYETITVQTGKGILHSFFWHFSHSYIQISVLTVNFQLQLMMIISSAHFFPFAAGPCLLSGLYAFCRTELCHRARAGGRAGRRNPEAVGADAGGEA